MADRSPTPSQPLSDDAPLLPSLAAWAGDTGAADALRGVGASPTLCLVTTDPALPDEVAAGGSPLSVLADAAGAEIRVHPVTRGGGTAARHPEAQQEGQQAEHGKDAPAELPVGELLDEGRGLADSLVDSGVRLILLGGTGSPVTTAAVTGTVCRKEPVRLVRHAAGDDVAQWGETVTAVRDTLFRARGLRNGPWDNGTVRGLLRILGSPDLAVTVGLLTGAAQRRTPVILDGADTLAAALLADAVSPGSARWWLASHRPTEPSAGFALDRLRLSPVLDRDLGADRGGAGLAVLPLLRAAVALTGR